MENKDLSWWAGDSYWSQAVSTEIQALLIAWAIVWALTG